MPHRDVERSIGGFLDQVPEGTQRQKDSRGPEQLRPSTLVSESFP